MELEEIVASGHRQRPDDLITTANRDLLLVRDDTCHLHPVRRVHAARKRTDRLGFAAGARDPQPMRTVGGLEDDDLERARIGQPPCVPREIARIRWLVSELHLAM